MALVKTIAVLALLIAPGCIEGSADPNDATMAEAMAIADEISNGPADLALQANEAEQVPASKDAQAQADATNAHMAAEKAKEAAKVSVKVAEHSVKITEHAKSALENAHDALHQARVDTQGLSSSQKASLKEAEKKLQEATKAAEYGQIKDAKYVKAGKENKKLKRLEKKMEDAHKAKTDSELEEMRKEIDALRKELNEKGDTSQDESLKELEQQIEEMEAAEKKDDKKFAKSHDEMKAEVERLRETIKELESQKQAAPESKPAPSNEATVIEDKGLDIDTAMPYGDLEPFGREDTAQELTEASIRESNEMVDQLERAEVAEEKRAVFRALTRLRGAAITSFDGVARSQTGNIDEYGRAHQWRKTHPLQHLADEESDVQKWAFPDNAD